MISYEATISCDGKGCTSTVTSNVFMALADTLLSVKFKAKARDWILISAKKSVNGKGEQYCPDCAEKVT